MAVKKQKNKGLSMRKIKEMDDGKLKDLLRGGGKAAKEGNRRPQPEWEWVHREVRKKKLQLSLRQSHKAGEKLFVDYEGHTVPVVDRSTSEAKEAQVFVAVLGASNYTYAEAISELLERLNSRPFKKLKGSRRSCFEEIETVTDY